LGGQITDQQISAAVARVGRSANVELADTIEPGLVLRVGAQCARWSYRMRVADHQDRLRMPLGNWPEIPVARARELVAKLRATFDPPAAEETAALTIAKLLARYDVRRLSQLRKRRVMLRAITVALAPVSQREASELTRRDISEIVDGMADRAPIHANRVLAYLKAFFGWAVGRGYLEANPAIGIAKPTREVTRDRTPSVDETVEIWVAAGKLGYPFGQVIRLLLLTASRRDEVGAMRTDEISLSADGDDGVWTLPASRSKNGRAIRMPLAPLARQVVAEALAKRTVGGELVFSTTGETPVSGWSRAKSRIDKLIRDDRRRRGAHTEMPPWRFHDLRRAFATAACDVLQIDPAVADRCLNHVGASTTSTVSRIYARNELFEQRRDALKRWADLIAAATGETQVEPPRTDHGDDHRRGGRSGSRVHAGR
jgi:integrase